MASLFTEPKQQSPAIVRIVFDKCAIGIAADVPDATRPLASLYTPAAPSAPVAEATDNNVCS